MFKKITLKNYRTHKSTTLELQPITLLIGNNSSGKTNFLSGIQHFSELIRQLNDYRPAQVKDYFPHRYCLANDDDPMSIEIEWSKNNNFVRYYMELYPNKKFKNNIGCKEKCEFRFNHSNSLQTLTSGYDPESNLLEIHSRLYHGHLESLEPEDQDVLKLFFHNFHNTFSYHLQPSFLKVFFIKEEKNEIEKNEIIDIDIDKNISRPPRLSIILPIQRKLTTSFSCLDYEGKNLQNLIYYIKTKDEQVFSRFLALMRRFANNQNFQGIRYDEESSKLLWQFDLGRTTTDRLVEEFPPEVLSDGLLKAAAIALLVSLETSPTLILMEEIENGINPGNIQELMRWIWQATAPNQKDISHQFILTSHSPSVLREFHKNLDSVYTFRLNKRNYQSDVRNLNQALETLIGIGAVEGEIIEDEATGKRLVEIPQYQLAELWYSGTIG